MAKAKKPTPKAAKKPAKKTAKKSAAKKPIKKVIAKSNKKAAKPSAKKVVAKKAKPVLAAKSKALMPAPKPTKKLAWDQFVTPLDDRVLVLLAGAEKMTAGGLYIPDTVSDVSGNLRGTVVAVGRGHLGKKGRTQPMDVSVGDQVVFPEFAGSKIRLQDEDLFLLRESELMGVVASSAKGMR